MFQRLCYTCVPLAATLRSSRVHDGVKNRRANVMLRAHEGKTSHFSGMAGVHYSEPIHSVTQHTLLSALMHHIEHTRLVRGLHHLLLRTVVLLARA
jgi:hypothetical protein